MIFDNMYVHSLNFKVVLFINVWYELGKRNLHNDELVGTL